MKELRLSLSPGLSQFSWRVIELFSLLALFLLPFSKSAAEIGFWVALIVWLLRKFPWNESFPRIRPHGLLYLLFLAFTLISLTQVPAAQMAVGVRGVLKWGHFFLLFFMSYELCSDERRRDRLIGCFLASMAFVTLDGFYQAFAGADLVKGNIVDILGRTSRVSGPFGSPNGLAIFFLFAIPLVAQCWLREKKWSFKALVSIVLLGLFSICFSLTFSRGPMFAIIAASASFFILSKNTRLAALLVLGVGVTLWAIPALRQNFLSGIHWSDISVSTRFEVWKSAWAMIKQSPWIGNGVNSFFWRLSESSSRPALLGYAHNCYLQMAADTGVISVIIFIIPFAWFLLVKKAAVTTPAAKALWVAVTAYLLHSFVDTNFYSLQAAMLFWIFWGAYLSLVSRR
jgi:O-antigen ligase